MFQKQEKKLENTIHQLKNMTNNKIIHNIQTRKNKRNKINLIKTFEKFLKMLQNGVKYNNNKKRKNTNRINGKQF